MVLKNTERIGSIVDEFDKGERFTSRMLVEMYVSRYGANYAPNSRSAAFILKKRDDVIHDSLKNEFVKQ